MSGGDVTLGYEIATKPMRAVVRRGEATAERRSPIRCISTSPVCSPAGLWYRFTSGDAASRIGRAATLPAPGAGRRLRFGFVSCTN